MRRPASKGMRNSALKKSANSKSRTRRLERASPPQMARSRRLTMSPKQAGGNENSGPTAPAVDSSCGLLRPGQVAAVIGKCRRQGQCADHARYLREHGGHQYQHCHEGDQGPGPGPGAEAGCAVRPRRLGQLCPRQHTYSDLFQRSVRDCFFYRRG